MKTLYLKIWTLEYFIGDLIILETCINKKEKFKINISTIFFIKQ